MSVAEQPKKQGNGKEPSKKAMRDAYRRAALALLHDPPDCLVAEDEKDVKVEMVEGGAWITAAIWLSQDNAEEFLADRIDSRPYPAQLAK